MSSFTPGYGAPEQFSRSLGANGPWTDVYALGLVFTELLAGRPALEGEDFVQLGVAAIDPGRRPTRARWACWWAMSSRPWSRQSAGGEAG